MESSSHGPGGDESKDPKPATLLSEGVTGAGVQLSEATASPSAAAAQDEGKKEEGRAKAQQQKPALKKPDKLAPCPRCDSLDTKFCYYNNYNVNQPRHFCKNCQRYWTAGGTLRNVPVGAGRRKNKHGSSQARHASLPDPVVRLDSAGTAQPRPSLGRGQSTPEPRRPSLATSSSTTVVPSSYERRSSDAVTQSSTFHTELGKRHRTPAEPQMSISSDHGGSSEPDKDDCTEACTSSPSHQDTPPAATTYDVRGPAPTTSALQPVCAGVVRPVGIMDGSGLWTAAPAPFGLYNGSWPYGYNVGWSGPPPGTPPGGALVAGVGWSAPPSGLFCWGSTIFPGLGAAPGWMAPGWGGGWSIPWGQEAAASAAATTSARSGAIKLPIRPVLSKHPRDRLELERVESSLWVPKMVRLDDPATTTAPRTSLWPPESSSSVTPGSNFKAFLPGKASGPPGDEEQVRS